MVQARSERDISLLPFLIVFSCQKKRELKLCIIFELIEKLNSLLHLMNLFESHIV